MLGQRCRSRAGETPGGPQSPGQGLGISFEVANVLWGQRGIAFRDEFLKESEAPFGARRDESKDPFVREDSAEALGKIGNPRAIQPLIEVSGK